VKKNRILSGTRPTGKLHLGNLLGAVENFKKLQGEDAFFMIADWHALTTEYETKSPIRENVEEVVLDYLASGLDPSQCTLFVQSEVSEHAELALLLSMITPIGWLERNPTYKDQMKALAGKDLHTHGFLGYPVLQAADILLYKADRVPVGEDQLPHLELTREIARRFHFLYKKEIFPEPQPILTSIPKLPGVDGRKMSKSYNNCIYLSDSREESDQKIKTMMTDPARKRREDKGNPEICPVYFYHKIFNEPDKVELVASDCKSAARGCVDCKKEMACKLNSYMAPVREGRQAWSEKKDDIKDILTEGAKRAREVASQTLSEAMDAVGMHQS